MERATKSNWKLTPIFLPPQFSWGGGEWAVCCVAKTETHKIWGGRGKLAPIGYTDLDASYAVAMLTLPSILEWPSIATAYMKVKGGSFSHESSYHILSIKIVNFPILGLIVSLRCSQQGVLRGPSIQSSPIYRSEGPKPF